MIAHAADFFHSQVENVFFLGVSRVGGHIQRWIWQRTRAVFSGTPLAAGVSGNAYKLAELADATVKCLSMI